MRDATGMNIRASWKRIGTCCALIMACAVAIAPDGIAQAQAGGAQSAAGAAASRVGDQDRHQRSAQER